MEKEPPRGQGFEPIKNSVLSESEVVVNAEFSAEESFAEHRQTAAELNKMIRRALSGNRPNRRQYSNKHHRERR